MLHWLEECGITGGVFVAVFVTAINRAFRESRAASSVQLASAWTAELVACVFDTPFGVPERQCGTALFGMLVGATLMGDTSKATLNSSAGNTAELRAYFSRKIEVFATAIYLLANYTRTLCMLQLLQKRHVDRAYT